MNVAPGGAGHMPDSANPRARAFAMFRLNQALRGGQAGNINAAQAMAHPQQWWRQYSAQNGSAFAPQGGTQAANDPAIQAAMQARMQALGMGPGPDGMGGPMPQGPDGMGAPMPGTQTQGGMQGFDPAAVMQKLRALGMIRQRLQGMYNGQPGVNYQVGMGADLGPQY